MNSLILELATLSHGRVMIPMDKVSYVQDLDHNTVKVVTTDGTEITTCTSFEEFKNDLITSLKLRGSESK